MAQVETFDEYLTVRYKPLELELIQKLSQHLTKNLAQIRKFCTEEWRKALAHACQVQQQKNFPCAYMSISLLNTSLIDNKPLLQVDFYNEEWVYGESSARYRMPADFLFNDWQEFKLAALNEDFYVRSKISAAEIKALFWGTLDKIIFLFTCYAKYFAPFLCYYDEFDDLIKAENFYITCGTYLDWQNRLFAVTPEIDLLNPEDNADTTFRTVTKKIFRGKKFSDLNLRGGYFDECTFYNFNFENVNLADAMFLRCRFISSNFDNVKVAGADFFECYFRDCTFTNSTSDPTATSDDADEYFAPPRMYHCFLINVTFDNCNFENIAQVDCKIKE